MRLGNTWLLLTVIAALSGCASTGQRAPVEDRSGKPPAAAAEEAPRQVRRETPREKDWRPETHTVQKGDTLFSIAFNYGLDYRELAELNGIQNPDLIQVGQQIRLFRGPATAVIRPPMVETRPIEPPVREQPRLAKYAYSEAAVAQIEKVQEQTQAKVNVAAVSPPKLEAKPETRPETKPEASATESGEKGGDDEALQWGMPAQGKLIGKFSESSNKGIDIAGTLGQPVLASAPGKVVYSGSGLRGYGKLVIIKHNKTYLSAYAHNDQVLVKEGEAVARGQKIAEMGNTDADQVKLHFEVRRFGKPVDPAKYLPLGSS